MRCGLADVTEAKNDTSYSGIPATAQCPRSRIVPVHWHSRGRGIAARANFLRLQLPQAQECVGQTRINVIEFLVASHFASSSAAIATAMMSLFIIKERDGVGAFCAWPAFFFMKTGPAKGQQGVGDTQNGQKNQAAQQHAKAVRTVMLPLPHVF